MYLSQEFCFYNKFTPHNSRTIVKVYMAYLLVFMYVLGFSNFKQ